MTFTPIYPSLEDKIIELAQERLRLFNGNQSKAAKSLGITRTTFRKYMMFNENYKEIILEAKVEKFRDGLIAKQLKGKE